MDKGQEIRVKGDRQGRRGWGTREKGNRYFPERDKGLPLSREERSMIHRQMTVYRGKLRNPMLCLVGLFWLVWLIRVALRGLPYFNH